MNVDLSMGIRNRYFDFSDYDTPVKTFVSGYDIYKTLKSFHKHVTMFLRKSEYYLNDDLVQYKNHQEGSYYSIGHKEIDIREMTDDTVVTVRFIQDPIIDQYERTVFTFLEMTGQLGGLYEVIMILTSFMISGVVQKFFTFSILKNLYYIE